jgi:hypothetical protein
LDIAPDLLAVVSKRRWKSRIVASAVQSLDWISDIAGPYAFPVLIQYLEPRRCIDIVILIHLEMVLHRDLLNKLGV